MSCAVGVAVEEVPDVDGRVDLTAGLARVARAGDGAGARRGRGNAVTALLAAGCVDRLIVSVAPMLLGAGIESIGDLGVQAVLDGYRLENRTTHHGGR